MRQLFDFPRQVLGFKGKCRQIPLGLSLGNGQFIQPPITPLLCRGHAIGAIGQPVDDCGQLGEVLAVDEVFMQPGGRLSEQLRLGFVKGFAEPLGHFSNCHHEGTPSHSRSLSAAPGRQDDY